ncbi:MAG: sigma-54-dependent transcriptional regulator [Rubricella sp.]
MSRVLVIEDAVTLLELYGGVLEAAGFTVDRASGAGEARDLLARRDYGVVVLDLVLADGDGLDLLSAMRARKPAQRVVVVTANGSVDRAVEAMRRGAFDFLVKPFPPERLPQAVRSAVPRRTMPDGGDYPRPIPTSEDALAPLIGSSPAMAEIRRVLRLIGPSSATAFITGESGTGKELCARAIHDLSQRAGEPFMALNCAAIPGELMESEVFGHVRGAFTGAHAEKKGAAEIADGGTLFLDEVCEMDPSLQAKLLRFLQTGRVRPVGSTEERPIDVRIVCATNRDPLAEVAAGRFREDLFYRLHVVPIHMPPLRERGEDVNLIADAMLRDLAAEEGKRFVRFSAEVRAIFRSHPWPGNARQLLNVLRNVAVLHDGETVTAEMLPEAVQRALDTPPAGLADGGAAGGGPASIADFVGLPLAEVERRFIEATIASVNGSLPRAAALLGVSPSTLYRKREAWDRADAGRKGA